VQSEAAAGQRIAGLINTKNIFIMIRRQNIQK